MQNSKLPRIIIIYTHRKYIYTHTSQLQHKGKEQKDVTPGVGNDLSVRNQNWEEIRPLKSVNEINIFPRYIYLAITMDLNLGGIADSWGMSHKKKC